MGRKPIFDQPMTQGQMNKRWRHKRAAKRNEEFARKMRDAGLSPAELMPWDGVLEPQKTGVSRRKIS